jgi:hypothetical protein
MTNAMLLTAALLFFPAAPSFADTPDAVAQTCPCPPSDLLYEVTKHPAGQFEVTNACGTSRTLLTDVGQTPFASDFCVVDPALMNVVVHLVTTNHRWVMSGADTGDCYEATVPGWHQIHGTHTATDACGTVSFGAVNRPRFYCHDAGGTLFLAYPISVTPNLTAGALTPVDKVDFLFDVVTTVPCI